MRVDFEADVHAALIDVYGETVTYRPLRSSPGSAPFEVVGIFDREAEVILEEVRGSEVDAPGHSTQMPVLAVRLADFADEPRQQDEIEIGAETFRVFDVQKDGRGMADLILRKKLG